MDISVIVTVTIITIVIVISMIIIVVVQYDILSVVVVVAVVVLYSSLVRWGPFVVAFLSLAEAVHGIPVELAAILIRINSIFTTVATSEYIWKKNRTIGLHIKGRRLERSTD